MTWTRVLVGAVLAATLGLAPSAWATNASVSGTTLTVEATGTTPVTVRLPGDAINNPPCDVAPCTAPTGPNPAVYVVEAAGVTAGNGCAAGAYPGDSAPADKVHCSRMGALWGAYTVIINGDGGDNNIRMIAPLVTGGEGNTGDVAWINGGAGIDTLVGSENNDFMSGGAGNDTMEGYAGNDILTGGTFQGGVDAGGLPNGISFDTGSFNPVSTTAGIDKIFGGGGSDIVTDGDSDATTVPTADVLSGFSCPGTGAAAGAGFPAACPVQQDTLNTDVPENDIDDLFWGHRTKAVTVNTTSPAAQGGCPTTAACAAGAAGGENEITIGFRGVYSGAGNDTLTGHSGAADVGNSFFSGAGSDRLDGLDGNDELVGGAGIDTLLGGIGGDFLNPGGLVTSAPGAANTTVTSDGADTVDGGADGVDGTRDSITYSGRSDDLTLNLNVTTGWGAAGENDTVVGVEDVTGGHGADTITTRSGVGALVESDPIAPEIAHPGEPALPTPPPGGYYSNDTVQARNGASDTIDCGGDAADPDSDTVVADRTPGDTLAANCEIVDLPPLPVTTNPTTNPPTGSTGTPPPGVKQSDGTTTHNDPTTKVKISGGASAGKIKVKKDGSFTLSKFVITCPTGSNSCSVKTIAASWGTKSYSIKGGTKGGAKGKLSKKGLKQLKKRKSLKATVTIRVVHKGKTTNKKVKVTFRR